MRRKLPFLPCLTLAALLLGLCLAMPAPVARAAGLIDYSKTPWGSPRDQVMKSLRRSSGGFAKSDQSETLVAGLGSISTRTWRYALKGSYLFKNNRLYRIDITPMSERGGSIPRQHLPELYNDLVGHHREEYGPPRLLHAKCEGISRCRRTEWLVDNGSSVLSISEILEEAPGVTISCYSRAATEEPGKAAGSVRHTRRGTGSNDKPPPRRFGIFSGPVINR